MTLSYAGINLPLPTNESQAWVEANLSLGDVLEFARLQYPDTAPTIFRGLYTLMNRGVRVGRLWWPRDAGRFAVGHWIVDDDTLEDIRSAVYGGSGYKSMPLVLQWTNPQNNREVSRISPSMWMLPPRPLAQPQLESDDNGLWLLTLVDDRFQWWNKSGQLTVTEGTTTWAQLYTQIGTILGVSIANDPVPATYLKPSIQWASNDYVYMPPTLDAIAYNCGQRITRGLDGTVRARNPVNAANDVATNRLFPIALSLAGGIPFSAVPFRQAGGEFLFDPTEPINDLAGVLPKQVAISFPQTNNDTGVPIPNGQFLEVVVPLTSLALPDFPPGTQTTNDTKQFHDSQPAKYIASAIQNLTELTDLTKQTATDWYRFQVAPLDWKYTGIIPWQPDALHDSVEWAYTKAGGPFGTGDCFTRVQRPPFDDLMSELEHGGGTGGNSVEFCCGGTIINNQFYTTIIWNFLFQTNYYFFFTWQVTEVTLPAGPYPGPVPLPTTPKVAFTGHYDGSTKIPGFSSGGLDPVDGEVHVIENWGEGKITLINESPDVAAKFQIYTDLELDYAIWPRSAIMIEYRLALPGWVFMNPTIGSDITDVGGVWIGTQYALRYLEAGCGIAMQDDGDGATRLRTVGFTGSQTVVNSVVINTSNCTVDIFTTNNVYLCGLLQAPISPRPAPQMASQSVVTPPHPGNVITNKRTT